MTREEFWQVIEASREGFDLTHFSESQAVQSERLNALLTDLTAEEIVAFDRQFVECEEAAYHWDLWGAAVLIEGGCSDDGFTDFRRGLIALGQVVYEAAIKDPETLAEIVKSANGESLTFEEFGYVAAEVYEAKTGTELPPSGIVYPTEPAGVRWNDENEDEDELVRRFPKLWAIFEDGGDED